MGASAVKNPSRNRPGRLWPSDGKAKVIAMDGERRVRSHWRGMGRTVLVATVVTGAATSPALLPEGVSTTTAAVVYVLAVTAASALAGLWAGLATSVLSFLALNFFFTPPFHTFTVVHVDDLVALMVFLVVSGTVGTLLSMAVAQRARAERREQEALLLHRLGTRLLSGEPTEKVVRSFAGALTDLLSLARCEIRTELTSDPIVVERARAGPAAPRETIDIVARGRRVGEILLFPGSSNRELADEELSVIQTFAGQMGLALEAARLGAEAEGARVDAETNKLRAALFSSVTHDLRTPLASITASVTSLLDPEISFDHHDRRDLLQTIHQEAGRLNRLVGNLLDLARLRAGALVPQKAPGSIEETIEGVVSRLQPILSGREVDLRLRDDLPEVPMDVVQIDQVLTNLVENAARFSSPGAPITVSAARWHDAVEVSVIDHGPGIPPGERDRVFEPFARGEEGEGAGTGLGLSIARAIVEAHGGKVSIKGTPGGGATVTFRLPIGG